MRKVTRERPGSRRYRPAAGTLFRRIAALVFDMTTFLSGCQIGASEGPRSGMPSRRRLLATPAILVVLSLPSASWRPAYPAAGSEGRGKHRQSASGRGCISRHRRPRLRQDREVPQRPRQPQRRRGDRRRTAAAAAPRRHGPRPGRSAPAGHRSGRPATRADHPPPPSHQLGPRQRRCRMTTAAVPYDADRPPPAHQEDPGTPSSGTTPATRRRSPTPGRRWPQRRRCTQASPAIPAALSLTTGSASPRSASGTQNKTPTPGAPRPGRRRSACPEPLMASPSQLPPAGQAWPATWCKLAHDRCRGPARRPLQACHRRSWHAAAGV